MCGICGEVLFDQGAEISREKISAMCETITHRGPDSTGVYAAGPVGLGSTRLSIIDVEGGTMPLSNEDDSIWIVFNGEIYNFAELRDRLERAGHRFTTRSDTETIVHLYEEEGDAFVRSLNGMFAIAIWDGRRRRLVLARDHTGVKPLHYAQFPDRLVFGSEIKAILRGGAKRDIDVVALHDYLSLNYVPGPRTMFAGIQKLLPGQILVFEADTRAVTVSRYWDMPLPNPASTWPKASGDVERDLFQLLQQVVHDQMVSDVPLGAFLSGGLDSSLVVALMSQVSSQPVRTFSIGFQERSYNELPYARIVAKQFKTEHHEFVLEPRAHDAVMTLAECYDEPFADSSALPMFAVSKLAAEHVKVALSGDGGDEVFGGYYTYQADRIAMLYRRLPHSIGSRLLPTLVDLIPVSDRKVSLDFKLKRFMAGGSMPPLEAHFAWKAFLNEDMKARMYEGTPLAEHHVRPTVELLQAYYDGYATDDILNRLMYIDTKVQLPDDMLTKVDRASMAHSLEVRVPLLDIRLVEFMARLPSNAKVRGLTLKYLLKRVAARLLPPEIMGRRKAGFSIPIARWIKNDLHTMIDDRLSASAIREQGLFNPDAVTLILDAHRRGRHDYSRTLWNLLMFSMWHERYILTNP